MIGQPPEPSPQQPQRSNLKLTHSGLRVDIAGGDNRTEMQQFAFHHVGIAVRDLPTAIPIYKSLFGYELISGPFDDRIQNVSVCFLSRGQGDTVLELVAPLGPNSPVDRALKKGGGPYHVCYQVQDLDAAIDHLIGQGSALLSGPVPAIAFEMRSIAWVMTDADLLVELVQS